MSCNLRVSVGCLVDMIITSQTAPSLNSVVLIKASGRRGLATKTIQRCENLPTPMVLQLRVFLNFSMFRII